MLVLGLSCCQASRAQVARRVFFNLALTVFIITNHEVLAEGSGGRTAELEGAVSGIIKQRYEIVQKYF